MPSWAEELQNHHPSLGLSSSEASSLPHGWLRSLWDLAMEPLTPHPTQPELEAWVHMSTDR